MFYVFHHEGRKLTLATDMGYVSDRIKGTIKGSNMFVFESNHDINMLQMGRYPWSTKRRILSDVGHVSNEDAAFALADVITDETSRIYLAHRRVVMSRSGWSIMENKYVSVFRIKGWEYHVKVSKKSLTAFTVLIRQGQEVSPFKINECKCRPNS